MRDQLKGPFAVSKLNSIALWIMRWPFTWGGLVTLGFYTLIHKGILVERGYLTEEFSYRYFMSHPVEYATVALFFVGLAALLIKSIDVYAQMSSLDQVTLGPFVEGGQSVDQVAAIQQQLAASTQRLPQGYFIQRLKDALQYIQRKGSADSLDEHLRYAGDMDAARMHSSYALLRIIIWAIPILGFLGTVLGITIAIAELGTDIENSLPEMIAGLEVAFDTTALSLALSMVLMFAQFFVDRYESRLLSRIDDQTAAELVGRFQEYGANTDPQTAMIRRMADAVLQNSERLVERQSQLWQTTIEEARQHWSQTAAAGSRQMEETLAAALEVSLVKHAEKLVQAEQTALGRQSQHWQEVLQSLRASTDVITKQHNELVKQGALLLKVVQGTEQIQKLEASLNSNLTALSNERNFEDTVLSLSAAIQLLSTQLRSGSPSTRIELHTKQGSSAAA